MDAIIAGLPRVMPRAAIASARWPADGARTTWHELTMRLTDDGAQLTVRVPGVAPERVSMQRAGRHATIRIAGASANDATTELRVVIPAQADAEALTARLVFGELHLTAPLRADEQPREVPITVG
jgi:HSP20 family molecular chaperone IbpA